jgi:cytochrome P450
MDDVLASVDLFSAGAFSDGPPHDVWAELRERTPVALQELDDGRRFWSVTRFADVSRVLADYGSFTSEHGTLLNILDQGDPAGGLQMAATDPPRHAATRGPMQAALSLAKLRTQRDRIRGIVRGLIAPAARSEQFDVAAAVGLLPMAVTGTLMGLPEDDWAYLTRLTSMSIAPDDPEYCVGGNPERTLAKAHRELFAYFQDHVDRTRDDTGDTLLAELRRVVIDDRPITAAEVLANSYSLLLGANVTTPHVATGALLAWAERDMYPAIRACAGSERALTQVVEEALRWASPAMHFMRYATDDLDLGGVAVAKGEAVVAWLASANRDAARFADPFTFRPDRSPNPHVAFGVRPHYCVGHTVARVALGVLFEEWFATVESYEVVDEPSYLHSNFIGGLKHLVVAPAGRA